jgi:hypothetical protein
MRLRPEEGGLLRFVYCGPEGAHSSAILFLLTPFHVSVGNDSNLVLKSFISCTTFLFACRVSPSNLYNGFTYALSASFSFSLALSRIARFEKFILATII